MVEMYGKALATIADEDDDDLKYGPNGGFTAVLSTPSTDRDGDSLLRDEWVTLPEHCTLDMDHGMSVATTVGSFAPYWGDDGSLMMRAAFSSIERAQEARTLVKERHVRDVSVAFMTDKSKKSGEARRELLNAGIVAIGSNRDAKILDSKALDLRAEEIAKERLEGVEDKGDAEVKEPSIKIRIVPELDYENLAKQIAEAFSVDSKAPNGIGDSPALTQAIHDAAVHLGAACYPLQPVDEDPTGASDGANRSVEAAETEEVPEADTKETFNPEDPSTFEVISTEDIPDDSPLGQWLAAFEKRLTEMLIGTKSPVESPADEAAAASEEEPAPAIKAADQAADVTIGLMQMRMGLFDKFNTLLSKGTTE
jgi:hypothetical protein